MADRCQLMNEINETSFAVNDLTLYLDTHPTDTEALELFGNTAKKRKQLLETYAAEFEPLTTDCVCPDTNGQTQPYTKYPGQKHFNWVDGPLPWEGGTL